MNGPWSQSMGALAAGNDGFALLLNRCANASLNRSTLTTGAASGFLAPPSSALTLPSEASPPASFVGDASLLFVLHATRASDAMARSAQLVHGMSGLQGRKRRRPQDVAVRGER